MATLEMTAPPGAQESAGGGGGAPADTVVIHSYLHSHQIKLPVTGASLKKQLGKLVGKGPEEREAVAYLSSLEQAKNSLTTALESTSVSEAAVHDAVATYLNLLLGLVSAPSGSNGAAASAAAAADAASPDEALAAAEGGAAPNSSPLGGQPSRLRQAVKWGWSEAVLAPPPGAQPRTSTSSDALYELASVLLAAALRLMHAAAAGCADSPSGVSTPASTRGYKLLREAAGVLEFLVRDVLPALPGELSADCDPQVVRALSSVAQADAQQLTMLRAVQKGNQAGLIASLAVDTAALYGQACSQLGSAAVAGAGSCKLWQYGQYKQAYCLAYAQTFSGIALWKADKAGDGLKSLEAAAQQLAAARRAAGNYDAAPPASLNLQHRRVDEELERLINETQRRMQRENDTVYIQRVPSEVPPLPGGKRLVSPLPYTLPAPAQVVKGGVVERCFGAGPATPAGPTQAPAAMAMHTGGGGGAASGAAAGAVAGAVGGGTASAAVGEGDTAGCSCCRFVAFIIAFPILAALWLVGAVFWLLLLPLKCCCPCIAFPIQWCIDLVLGLMKLPARSLLWASGKPEYAGESGSGGANKK